MYPVFIYTLNCPTTGIIRYCGQTANPDIRFERHIKDAYKKDWHVSRWIKKLVSKNLRPIMEILDVVPDNEADFWEIEYIQNFRERGFDLTNISDGGNTPMRGRKHKPETRAKISASHKGKTPSPETRVKLSAWQKGKPGKTPSLETRVKLSAWQKGRILSPEHRAKISAHRRGKKQSPETCAKISAATIGRKKSPEECAAISERQRGDKSHRFGKPAWNKGMKNGKRTSSY